jgi:hypothetical protein
LLRLLRLLRDIIYILKKRYVPNEDTDFIWEGVEEEEEDDDDDMDFVRRFTAMGGRLGNN